MWEVVAQMLGLGGSILALRAIENSGSPTNVLWAWATFQVHPYQHNARAYKGLGIDQLSGSLLVGVRLAGGGGGGGSLHLGKSPFKQIRYCIPATEHD